MPKALVVSSADLEPRLGRTVLWRADVERKFVTEPEAALEAVRGFRPQVVVVDVANGEEIVPFIRRLRVDPTTRSTAIVMLCRSSSAVGEPQLRDAGANLVISDQVDPMAWDPRLEELLSVPHRRESQIPVLVRPWSGLAADSEAIEGLALNISVHGILLESTRRLDVGTNLDLQFRLPGSEEPLQLVGQVVRAEAVPRSGIKFVVHRGDARERIRAFVGSDRRSRVQPELHVTAAAPASPEGEAWEAELRASEARKAAILEAALDCVVTIDQEGRILDFNRAAERTFGYARAAVMGRRMVETLIPPRLREQHQHEFARHLATGERPVPGRRVEMAGMRADGSEFPVELAIMPLQVRGRRLFTGYLRDITERKRAEAMLSAQAATTRVLAEAVTVQEATPKILQALCEGFGWDCGALWIVEADALRRVEFWRAATVEAPRLEAESRAAFARGVGLLGRAWEKAEPLWVPDLDREPSFLREAAAREDGFQTAVALPVLLGGRVLGVIELFARQPRCADTDLLESLLAMGSQIGQFMERRRAEEAGLAREARFRALIENSADAIALLSQDARAEYVTPSATRVLGYSAEEHLLRTPFDLVHADDAERARSQWQKCVASPGVPVSAELRARHKDGHWRWVAVDIVNRLDDPHVRAIVANYRDITERKMAEESLWESETRLREVVSAAPIVLWAVDRQGVFTLAEGKGFSAQGFSSRQLVGRSVFDVYSAYPQMLEHVKKALGGEELTAVVEAQGMALETHCAPLREASGEISGVIVVATDITGRRRAEAAVEEQRDFLRRVLDISPSFIFAKDRQGRFTLVNQAVADAYGTTVEDLLGRTDADFNPNAEEVAAFLRDDLEVMDSRREKLIPEEVITDASGRRRWLQTVKRPMLGPEGAAHQVLGFATDITERKRAEAIQSALYRIAKAASTARDMDTLYAEIHAIVGELMFAKNFYIALYDETADLLSFPFFVDERDPKPASKKPGKGLTEYVLREGQPLLASPDRFGDLVRRGDVELIGAPSIDWLGVPLQAHDETLGVLVVQSYSKGVRYGHEELQVLAFVSQHIAEAIERKRAEEAGAEALAREQAARREAEALRDANFALAQDLSLDAVLESLLDCLRRLVPYDTANVMLLEGESRLAIRAIRGYERWTNPERVTGMEFDADRTAVLRELLATRMPVLIADTTERADWERRPESTHVRNWLGVPLVAGGKFIGLYSLDKAEAGFFTAEHIRLAEGLAGPAARAVLNAQLYEQRRRYIAALEKANRELVASEERFRMLADHIPGTIYLCRNDERYSMLYLNDAVETLTGYPKRDFLEGVVNFPDLYHPDDAASIRAQVDRALAQRQPFHLVYRLKHRSSAWRSVEEWGAGVFGSDEKPSFLEGFLSDVTEGKSV